MSLFFSLLSCSPIKAVNSFHRRFFPIFLSPGAPRTTQERESRWGRTLPLQIQFVLATAGASSWLQSAFPLMTFFPFSKTLHSLPFSEQPSPGPPLLLLPSGLFKLRLLQHRRSAHLMKLKAR